MFVHDDYVGVRKSGFHWKPASTWNEQICTEDEEMLVEFSVVPIGKGESVSQYVAECIKIVEDSGIAYKINPMGTVLEGDYDEVMAVIRKCHMRVMELCPRVITSVKIDDRKGARNALQRKITSVEEKVGKELKK
jgi:uncharacterized protein (TIGR00106 family)